MTLAFILRDVKEQIKPKINRKKEIIKIRVDTNEIENRKTIKSNETNSQFFEINKTDKPLARLVKLKTENINYPF